MADEIDIEAESVEVPETYPFNSAEDVLAWYQMRLRVPKDQRNDFGKYNYRNMEGINDAFHRAQAELWEQYGILTSLHFPQDKLYYSEGVIFRSVTAKLHTPFGSVSTVMTVREPESQGGMSPSQVGGSSSSYAKKYAASDLFALGGEADPDELPPAVENRFPSGKFDVRCRRCGQTGQGFSSEDAMHLRCNACGAIDWEPIR